MNLEKDFNLFGRSNGLTSTEIFDYQKYQNRNVNIPLINKTKEETNQITPYIIEERDRRFTQIDVLTYLIGQGIISVNGEIEDNMISLLRAQILYLSELDNDKDIEMYIDTPGGSVSAGLSLYDTMNFVPNDISTINFGMCASMGSILVSSGTRGKRKSLPNSRIMIHQLSGGSRGHFLDMESSHKQAKILNNILFTILSANCGKPKEEILKDCSGEDRDIWFLGKEGMSYGELGLIDGIIETKKKNRETNNLISYKNL